MTRQEMIDRASDNAGQIFLKAGELVPIWECHLRDGSIVIVATPFDGNASKDTVSMAMRHMFKEKDVIAYVYVSEAWAMTMATPAEADAELGHYGSVAQHPKREEVLTFVCEDANGTTTGHRKITRLPDGKPQLGELETHDSDQMQGRFVGLLPTQGRPQ